MPLGKGAANDFAMRNPRHGSQRNSALISSGGVARNIPDVLASISLVELVNQLAINKGKRGRLESGSVDGSKSVNTTCRRSSPMRREAYRAVNVKQVWVESLVADRPQEAVSVGLDIAKDEFMAVLRWSDGSFERPWRAKNSEEIPDVVQRLQELAEGRSVTVAMESTGTYGDALRQALTDARLAVHRVSGKAVHDYAEIFDGVPSQHDGKDAAIVAELAALGKSCSWPYQPPAEVDGEIMYWVDRLDVHQRVTMLWLCRLEGLLARHWPEATRYLELNSATLLRALAEYGGPAAIAADPRATERLRCWGGRFLNREKIERFVQVAGSSVGVRQTVVDVRRMQEGARAALSARDTVHEADQELGKLSQGQAVLRRQAAVVGATTACVLWVYLGDPADYHCGEAYRKAMGLNLKERSSGRYQGQLKISKRGPGAVRRWLYYAAMRLVQKPRVHAWYEAKKGHREKGGKRALIAVARKLALGLYAVGVSGEPFDAQRLFAGETGKGHRRRGGAIRRKREEEQNA
jgi:transposase